MVGPVVALGDLAGSEGDLGGLAAGNVATVGGVEAVGVLVYLRAVEVDDFGVVTGDAEVVDVIRIAVILTAVLMYWIFGRIEAKMVFKVFGVFYVGAIVMLNCVAGCVLAASPCFRWFVFLTGTLLFLVSDVILIINNFGPKASFTLRVSNLMLYYVGQLLIALSLQLPLP